MVRPRSAAVLRSSRGMAMVIEAPLAGSPARATDARESSIRAASAAAVDPMWRAGRRAYS